MSEKTNQYYQKFDNKNYQQYQQQGSKVNDDTINQQENKIQESKHLRNKAHKSNDSKYQKFVDEDDFNKDFDEKDIYDMEKQNKKLEKNEEKLKMHNKVNQVGYFGYELESFGMQQEREAGLVTEENVVQLGRRQDEDIDPWLQEIDQKEKSYIDTLKRKQTKSVFDDKNDVNEGDDLKKKIKTDGDDNDQKQMFMRAPVFMLKTKISQLLDEKETINQHLQKLQKIFQATQQQQKKMPFKKNIRKKDRELLEKQMLEEQNKAMPTQEQKDEAKSEFDMIIEMADCILQKTGNAGIYALNKEQIIESIKTSIDEDTSGESEKEEEDSEENEQDDDIDQENENIKLDEGQKKGDSKRQKNKDAQYVSSEEEDNKNEEEEEEQQEFVIKQEQQKSEQKSILKKSNTNNNTNNEFEMPRKKVLFKEDDEEEQEDKKQEELLKPKQDLYKQDEPDEDDIF